MSKGFQDAVWNGLDTRRYDLENMPEYTPPEDVGYIKSIGQNVLSGIESTLGGAGMFIGANMASGSPDYSKGGMMGKASNVGRDFGAGLMNESQYLLNDAGERQAKYGASPMDWGGLGDAITNPDYWLSPRGLTADVAQGIGSSLPTLVAGGIGGKVAFPLLSAIASGIGRQALKEGAASAAGKALSYMGGFGVGGGASEAISDAGSNYNDILQNLQGKVNPDGTPMYDEQGAITEATRRMNDLGLSEMPYLMASNALTGGMVAGKMSKLLGQDSKSIGRRALANVFGAGADMTGEGFTEVAQTTLANDAMDKPSGNMWNPREWDEAQSDSFRGGFMGALLPAAGGGAYNTVFGDIDTSDGVEQLAPQVNNNLFGAGTAEISTQGADIDEQVAHLKDGYQSVIPQVAGVLVNDFGIEGAQISSGFRTREHNKEVGGAENSYHVGDGEHGDALDIVLPDGVSAETAEAIKQRFKDSGVFDEVLFHDAGSGYHLHLGGLKTDNIGNSYGSYSGNADVDSAINEMAEKYNLDPALLAAIAEQESGFNQSAQSEAGAMGIMQLMPGTAEGLGVDPSDLRGNLEGGAKYLRQMLDKYDGDVEKALAAYNAGPGSLDSVNGDISQLSGETQKYVPSVMERYNKFKNKSGGGISSSGNILDWDSTNEDFSKLDFFPKDGEQSQGTVNEFLENLAKLEESDDKDTKEKGRQAQDILQQYGDDIEKLTEKAKELGYQQTVDPAEVHGRIPMKRIVSTALDKGQVTFATKKAADIFASSPIGQTMERQGKTFKVTDNFKMNEQVNAISQQVYSGNTARTKTVSNGVTPDVASQGKQQEAVQSTSPESTTSTPLSAQEVDSLNGALQTMPEELRSQIQGMMANEQYDDVRAAIQKYTSNPANKLQSSQTAQAGDTLNALLNIPEAMSNSTGTRIDGNKVRSYIESGNLPMMNRAINAMSQNLREHGMDPRKALGIYDVNTLPAVQGERMPSTDVQREEPAIEGTVEDTVITPPYNGKPDYNKNQLEAPAIESDHLNSEDFLAVLSPVERGFMEYLDKMFDNLQLGFNDVLEYLRARQKDIFNKRMESVIQQGPQGLTGAFYTNGGKMVVDNNMPQEVQNAWNQLLSMRKNFGASLANSTAEIQNEYMRVESVVKDYLTTAVTEQCKNNVSWRKLNYAITGLEAIADKARRYERSVSEEGKRGSTKSYRDVSAEEGQAIEDSAVAWSGAIHQYGTTETRLRSFLNTLGSNFTKNNHGMALRAKTKYKGQPMNKAGRIEALIRDGGRVDERGKEYFAVSPNGDETKVTKGEHNYYKWLRQNGFAQQDRAPEGAPQLTENNGVTEDSYRARQPEYNGKESHEEDVKKEESTKGQTKPQSNDNPNASNEPMRKELIEQAAANEDTWVNSKKSELHLEDDNDTVVKLTPQELKYYQDLVKKGVVAKPELYEETQEDVGEMDDNVEMSKEQKQLYDESNDDRDVPDSDSEPHTSGKSTKVVTADGKEYNVHYEVRPESKITASNNLDGSVNKDYPSELQPRNRQRVGNLTQVAEIAGKLRPADLAENRMLNHGAPLIREDGVVLNGNGRIMAIRTAVKNGTDHGYKQYLIDHAEELGLNPDNIEHMENPVLVKVVDDELTADDVKAITTDTSGGQRMSASEQAKTDAKKIKPSTLNMYQPNESGELMGNNKYFLGKLLENILPADERNAYYTEDGSISKDGLMRAQRALFALAYGNDKLIDTFAETTNEQAKNLINALNANAATIAKLQRMIENGNAHDLKLRDNLVNAINALRSAVLDGKPAERIWKETSMFEEAELTPETKALAKAMDGFRKSGKKLTNFIAQLADNNLRHGDPKQETMFDGTDDFSLMKDIASAKDKIANGGQANIFEAETIKRSRINIHSAEAQKENGNSNTELDRLPKVPIAKLRQSEQKIVRFGKAIGVPVHFVESSDTTNRGVFTHNGEIFINRKAKVPAHSVFVHEFVHWLKASPENAGAYDVLHACLENSNGLFNEARINKYRGKIFDGEKMTDEEIVEEIICDAMTQTESAEKLMRAVNNVDSNLVTRIAGCLKAMWDKFCEYMNFNQHKMSNEQHLPNELSVAEFQRADTAFNKILMNLKNDNGEPVFHRVGTELLLRDTNAKPVEAYQINPISYTYAFASADNNPNRISPREQDIQYMSAVKAYQNESDPAKKESMLDKIRDNDVRYSRELKHSKQGAFFDAEKHKQAQLEIVQNTNPMTDDYHVGIRTVEDIRTAEEAFKEADPDEAYVYPDFTEDDAQEALSNGKITVYSSYPIGQGVFVSPSRMMAEDYAGGGKIYSAEVSLKDVAWINDSEGMLAKVDRTTGTSRRTKYSRSRGVDLSPSTDGVAIAARANNNLVANMKGIVKKANAKFNPFHHEELKNLRIDKRDEEKDLNLIEYQFVSPTREGKKYKVILPFIMKGKQAMAKQEKLRFEFNEGMNEVDKLLGWREGFHRNDSKFKERKEALNEILLKGDLEGKEFTNDELIKAGYDAETIKGYRKMRELLDKAWKLANDTKSRIKYQSITSSTLRRAEADFADLKDKNPFAEIISKVHNPDGTVTINYKAPHVRRVAKQTVLPSELENLRKNKDVHIVETTQSLKGTTQVTYYQREAGMGKLKGYIPHVFHGWYVCKVDKDGKAIVDEDGNVAMDNIVTTANSLSEAAKLGRELAKANPNTNYRVVPQTFSAPGAQEQAIVMGDFDYAKIVGKVADSMSMSITDAQAMLDNTVKMKNRGRFYGYAKQRKGFKGFEQNVYLATMKYFNQTARYAAMDSFKRDSISMYNRIFGAFDDENVTKRSAMAKWTKQYIYDVNGTPTWIEKFLNNTLHSLGVGEERAGGRPVLWFQQKIMTYPMTILKLGVFNPSSALLNLTQLFNLYGAMGEKVLSPQAYQRLLHKGFADTFRAMNNKDSELGKLLWKDLGLDYQIGMDVASGYSNAEVNNLASLRGFASRLAGKSMYLFRQSDAFARGVTLLTAYNKALDEGKSKAEAIEYAKQINDKVNFDYSVADEPTIFRALGPISKVFLQFKKYPVKQLELFQDFYLDGRELGLNRKQSFLRMVKYMAPYMAMSGMMGIPFISLAGGLLSYFAGIATGDDDWDWEKKAKQFMITEFGEDCPLTQWWLYGAGSFIGLNLGSRVGVGDFMGSDSYNSADGLGGLMWNQTTLGSTINQVSRQLSYRNYAEALKAINPTLGNIALAYKGEVRTTRGRMKYQYQNMAERMWRAIGFTPLNETLAGDLASNEYAEKQEQTKAKQKAIDDFLADPSSENAARLNELGVTPKSLENESARRTMNRHQLNELAKEKEAAKKKKKPKTYSASDYLKAVQ